LVNFLSQNGLYKDFSKRIANNTYERLLPEALTQFSLIGAGYILDYLMFFFPLGQKHFG